MMVRAGIVVLLLAVGTTVSAHPLTPFGARIALTSSRIIVTLNADADLLLGTLDALAAMPPSGSDPLRRIELHRTRIEERSLIHADGHAVPMVVDLQRMNADGQIEVVLSGDLPADTRAIIWQSHLVFGTYPVSVTRQDDTTESVVWVDGSRASDAITIASDPRAVATLGRYVQLGFEHILPKGLDHILFVLGLFLLTPNVRALLAQVTVFTVAHSLSLGLAIGEVITLPPQVVEPLIALSIAYVGLENLRRNTLTTRRLWVVAGFGLLHGLGFAGVLAELSLPSGQWVTALAGFNIGVELGQVIVLMAAAAATAAWRRLTPLQAQALHRPASTAIAVMGVYWFLSRL